jgi:hypothetical protein
MGAYGLNENCKETKVREAIIGFLKIAVARVLVK